MTLEQLRIFVAVAEREHVTQAARDLNLTQSATSAAVAALEARYATKLFDRVGRRISLTDAGRLFLVEARAVLARASAAELVLADLAGLRIGSLALAASQTVGNYWLPKFIHRFQSAYPALSVTLAMGNTETVAELVRDGAATLGFVEGKVEEPALTATSVGEDEMLLMVPTTHSWAKAKASDIDLRDARWVLREHGSGTRAILEGMFRQAGIALSEMDDALVLPTNEAVRTAVEAGAGVAVLSKLVATNALQAGNLVAVDFPVPRREFFMLRHKQHYVTAVEREFVAMVGQQRPAGA
ncbi:LysR family transcriptional regulator [Mesorhizobium sp. Root554]|uniref:LysR family transcriptional regulator n=1 Tax=unclassified Mesorhizobium TaxID=325217 RepID=UPI0006FDE2F4|nr:MULTISPECIES: LysR family transcriptional regulator [unclassified Mesorhizobium]KQZ14112.1 LysR family transcriptional regulator [Mesorhizobium sp. Root1471]KQZ36624.1 LysR family transcriptional regulator [Mesorhizobium sp. Root554]